MQISKCSTVARSRKDGENDGAYVCMYYIGKIANNIRLGKREKKGVKGRLPRLRNPFILASLTFAIFMHEHPSPTAVYCFSCPKNETEEIEKGQSVRFMTE